MNTPRISSQLPSTLRDLETVRYDVNALLTEYFKQNVSRSSALDQQYGDLWQAMRQFSEGGGKRLRPYLLVLAYQAFGGQQYEKVLPVAAAQELLHLSLLIHDDIIDKDLIRYGQDNVAGQMIKKYSQLTDPQTSAHYANGAAILAGDLLIAGAHQLVLKSSLHASQQLLALQHLDDALYMVGGGELLDMESGLHAYDDTDTLKIAELKTARYSFVSPLLTGAELADAPDTKLLILTAFATALGIAYQLADDLLGMFGDEAVTGKSNIGDIREGKHTYLVKSALALASSKDVSRLKQLLGNTEINMAEAAEVRAILETCGARQRTVDVMRHYADEAMDCIQRLGLKPEAVIVFKQLISQLTERSL